MGAWRVEVSPAAPETTTLFLHFIEAGLAHAKERANDVRAIGEGVRVGVEFACDGATNRVWFGTQGDPSCNILVGRAAGRVECELDCTLQTQADLGEM
jgi:hypothetical protein